MPTTIHLERLIVCAENLYSGVSIELATGVRAQLLGNKLVITENGTVVFHMKVIVHGTHLDLDYPRTTDGHEGRGWARLGLLLALRYGMHAGCTTAAAATQLEPGSYSFWVAGNLQYSVHSNLQQSIVKIMLWINANIPQPTLVGTSVMIIRDRVSGSTESKKPEGRKRSNSYNG